jgi:hypothetical protein
MLLRTMSEPSTTEGRRIQGELKGLLEDAAVRQAESSHLRLPEARRPLGASRSTLPTHAGASVHTERTRDGTPTAPDRLGDNQRHRDR